MLQIEYINSFNHNYIKLHINKEQIGKQRYQYKILENKRMEGLLPVSMYTSDGEQGLYYDISSMQSLSKWFVKEKIGKTWINNMVSNLRVVLWSLEQYLLDGRNLILRPDCIFQDMESEKMFFIYYPYYVEEFESSMEAFLSFLIENADEEETGTVESLYDIFSDWENMREQFTVEMFLSIWEAKESNINTDADDRAEAVLAVVQEDKKDSLQEKEKGKRKDIAAIFGRNKSFKAEERLSLAMEQWEYRAEKMAETSLEGVGKTTYVEVKQEMEERKLYGNGKQNRKVICLQKMPIVIGKKGEMTDVVLQDPSISRMHARLTEQDGQVYLEDLNATNGTYKNGVRLRPYEKVEILKEDEIRLGKLSFTYR